MDKPTGQGLNIDVPGFQGNVSLEAIQSIQAELDKTTPAQVTEDNGSDTQDSLPTETAQSADLRTENSKDDKNAQKAREYGSNMTDALRLLFDLDNRSDALDKLKSKPALYNEAKKRFPKELSELEGGQHDNNKESGVINRILDVAEREAEVEKSIMAKEFSNKYRLNSDEFHLLRETANDLVKSSSKFSYDKALEASLRMEFPDKAMRFVAPEAPLRNEVSEIASVDAEYAQYAKAGVSKENISLMKELKKNGANMSTDHNGVWSMSL